jgi:predicted TIM-barrel fold metal-dependent hydrolase
MAFREGAAHGSTGGCGCGLSRRGWLAGATGLAAALGVSPSSAQTKPDAPRRIIDVHAHVTPPNYLKALLPEGVLKPATINWSLAKHLDQADKDGVERTILSLSAPGVPQLKDVMAGVVRDANEYTAKICGDHKDKLGWFVYLSLNDIDNALKELTYGLDVLKANGVAVLTNYDGKWLGHPAFDSVWQELERRKAVVYTHPTAGACCTNLVPTMIDAMVEFGSDTTRAIGNYVYSGAARRYPNVKMIWSHAGGTMPYLMERFDHNDQITPAYKISAPNGFRAEVVKFFYDTAQASNPVSMAALRGIVPTSQILFGTDYPYRTPGEHIAQLESGRVFNSAELKAIYRGNVQRAMPGLLA